MIWFSEAANKIGVATTGLDTTAPAIAIATPTDGAHLAQGASVAADYTCDDRADGSGVVGCAGPVARGAALDTSAPGPHAFAVTATDLAGNVTTSMRTYVVDAPPAPPAPPSGPSGGPGLAIASASLRAAYVESELHGTLTVAGTAGAAARVEVRLRRGVGGRAAATLVFRTGVGPFRRTLRLPARLLPGRLSVSASAPGLAVTVAPAAGAVTIARPPAGIADVAIVSTSRRGPAATSVRGAFRQLWVRFHLAVRPAPGRPLTVTWFAPGARRGKVVGRPDQAAIESFVRSPGPRQGPLAGRAARRPDDRAPARHPRRLSSPAADRRLLHRSFTVRLPTGHRARGDAPPALARSALPS